MESNNSSSLSSRFIKWTIFGIVASVISYWGIRQYSIAHCRSKNCDSDDPINELLIDLKQAADVKKEMWLKNVKASFFTKGILEAFEVIDQIMENLNEFGLSGHHYKTPRLILLGLIKRVQEERHARHKAAIAEAALAAVATPEDQSAVEATESTSAGQPPQLPPTIKSDQICLEQFEAAKHIGNFAINLYYASWLKDPSSIAKTMGLESQEDVLLTWFQDSGDDHCPKFAIFLDRASHSIILAIRGTFSFADAVSDIVCDEDPFLDGFAHRGILNGARKILKESEVTLREAMAKNPDYKLVITGHSLGAGTAELITLNILFGKVDFVDPAVTKVRCIALAPPPVYRSEVKLPKEIKSSIEIYINNNDCVPRLSLGVIAKLLAMMKAVDGLPLSTMEQLQILGGFKDQKALENLSLIEEAMSDVGQDKFPFLQHPGTIFYICKHEDQLLIQRQKSKFFSMELLLLETMILDHLHLYYREALSKVKLT